MPGNLLETIRNYAAETLGIAQATVRSFSFARIRCRLDTVAVTPLTAFSDDMISKHPANGLVYQANDAAAQAPSRDLPELSSVQDIAPPSASPPTVIDLSSPPKPLTKPLTSSMRHERLPNTRREQYAQVRRSADERRLLPDFSIPTDAVPAPDPRSFMPRVTGIMHQKPRSNAAFKPMNTLEVNPRAGLSKPKTYEKHHRPYAAPIGKTRHAGQQAYIQKHSSSPITPARDQAPRIERARASGGASPGKRRKIEHVIELSDQESAGDEREVFSSSALQTTAGTSRRMPPSATFSQSQSSNGSASAITGRKPSRQESAFQVVDSITNAHRKKARKLGTDRQQGTRHISPSGGGNLSASTATHGRAAPIEIYDDELADQAKQPRQQILRDFTQGAQVDPSRLVHEHAQSSRNHDKTKSPYFPNLRVNESTSKRPAADRQAAGHDTELHTKFRQAPRESADFDDSEDELGMSDMRKLPHKLAQSHSKAIQAAKTTAKRKTQSNSLHKADRSGWPLLFARSHGYEGRCLGTKNDQYELILRVDKLPWRVREWDPAQDGYETQIQIDPNEFIKAQADSAGRIRLEGSRKRDGNFAIVDLEFVNTSDHLTFRDEYARNLVPSGKVTSKQEQAMQRVFDKALVLNDKVGTSELVEDSIFDADSHHGHAERVNGTRTPRLDFFMPGRGDSESRITTKEERALSTTNSSSKVSTRPKRSTRSSVFDYDETTYADTRVVYKYSIDHGLGAPWPKPLDIVRGRHRAVVHFNDLPRLDEEEYLNDSLIDFYMIYLCDKFNVPADKVYFFNTHFFTQLTRDTGRQSMNYKAVAKWTSKSDIFGYDYIVVPINEATHWYLAIICNVSNIARKPMIEDFDNDLAEALNQSRKDVPDQHFTEESEAEGIPQLQQQDNVNSIPADPKELDDDDTTLFEVDSKLNLVDRDDLGNEGQMDVASSQTLSMPLPQSSQIMQALQLVPDVDILPEGILPNLTLSPARKKTKRKHTFPKKDPNQPIILILDSLSQTRSGTVRALKDWLAAEGEARRGMEVTIKEKGYYPKATQIPMQDNWTDCGVYLLGYVEKFFQNPDQFKNRLLMGEMSATEDWPEFKPVEMRDNMRNIIMKLAADQKDARKAEKKLRNGAGKPKISPPAPDDEPTKPLPKAPPSERPSPDRSETHDTKACMENWITQPEKHGAEATPAGFSRPRLSSPFSPKVQLAQKTTRVSDPETAKQVSNSPPGIFGSTPSSTDRARRRKSPEVRIPRTPLSARAARHGEPRSSNPTQKDERTRQMQGASASSGPSKRQRGTEDEDLLRLPPLKKTPVKQHQAQGVQSSQAIQRSQDGNASQPIMIGDSQDDKWPAFLEHSPPTIYAPARRVLHSHPSIEEISAPAQDTRNRGHGTREDLFPSRELEVKLKEAADERNKPRNRRPGYSPSAPIYLERRKESPLDVDDVATHDSIEVKMPESLDEYEIPETPEHESRGAI